MFYFREKKRDPLAGMKREVEGLRLQDKNTVTLRYQAELEATDQKIKEAKLLFEREKTEIQKQGSEYTLNENIVEAALEACVVGDLGPIRAAKRRGGQTWEVFCQSYPLHIVIKQRHTEAFKFLLENNVEYRAKSAHQLPAYEEALTLVLRRKKTPNEIELAILMMDQILKDIPVASEMADLLWLFDAINYSEKIINSPIPGAGGITPIMQLARDNHLQALIKLDKDFKIEYQLQDDAGRSVFDHAFECGHRELSLWLLQRTKSTLPPLELTADPLIWAIMKQEEKFSELITTGVNIKSRDNLALIAACCYGDLKQVKTLYFAGADLNARKSLPLKIAIQRRDRSLIQYLLMHDVVYEAVLGEREAFEVQLKSEGFDQSIQELRLGWLAALNSSEKNALMEQDASQHPNYLEDILSLKEIIAEAFKQLSDHDEIDILEGFPRFARSLNDTIALNIPIAHLQNHILSFLGIELRKALEKGEIKLDIQYSLEKKAGVDGYFIYTLTTKSYHQNGKIENLKDLAVICQYQSCRLIFDLNIHVDNPQNKNKGVEMDAGSKNSSHRLNDLIDQLETLVRIGSSNHVAGADTAKRIATASLTALMAQTMQGTDVLRFNVYRFEKKFGAPSKLPSMGLGPKLFFSPNSSKIKSLRFNEKASPAAAAGGKCGHV